MAALASEREVAAILEPPAATREELEPLRSALDGGLPAKVLDRNLLVATWNVRAFGDMSDSWKRGEKDSPKRNRSDVLAIAEILSRFDVIAVQEARANLRALRHAMKALGPEWGLILTDVNPPPAGNGERLAFLFDTRRVKPSGLAAELVVPDEWLKKGIDRGALSQQFVRTPYAVSFVSGGQTFILVTLHVIYGKQAEDRTAELAAIAEWLADWAKRTAEDYNQNLICLGDFNIDRKGDANFEAFTSTGLRSPAELDEVPRTVSDDGGDKQSFYDQIAWFVEDGREQLTLDYRGKGHAGGFDWRPHLLSEMKTQEMSWHISDHFPLWVEFTS